MLLRVLPNLIPSVPVSAQKPSSYFTSPISILLTSRSTAVWHGKWSGLSPSLCLINSLIHTLFLTPLSLRHTHSFLILLPFLSLSFYPSHPLSLLHPPCCWPPHTQHLHMLLFNIWSAPSCRQHQWLHGLQITSACISSLPSVHLQCVITRGIYERQQLCLFANCSP